MDDKFPLSGRTRIVAIFGDPIAQVKSPAGVTEALKRLGRDCVVVPAHVTSANVGTFLAGVAVTHNVAGLIATIPHKFAAYSHCKSASARAHALGAVNVMRRNDDGSWHGDMLDGIGFVAAARDAGCVPENRRALLVGAGGAGSAIALALLDAGVAMIAIHDGDIRRRDTLQERLAHHHPGRVLTGTSNPRGFDVIVNATPAGMRDGDLLPVDAAGLSPSMFVGDVITQPVETPLLAAARAIGCRTQTGVGMFGAVAQLMLEFFIAAGPLASPDA